jgi:molybdenum cofactor cytidylyltransferase
MSQVVGLLLAAGQSTRFGSNKLLHPVIGNRPMLLVCAEKLVNAVPDSVVIISDELSAFTTQLEQLGLRVVVNEQAEQGMGSSIACGVSASEDASGWLIMLADMPYIKTETIQLLANELIENNQIIAPMLDQHRGHPVGFGQRYKNDLLALHKDRGAREIIHNNQHQLTLVAVNDTGIINDVDQPIDLLS